ncbi:DNA repair protein RadC [Patescibacteria group bacterium]|nr:DNA repair protein RadC [Patescibacteria group bacterium]
MKIKDLAKVDRPREKLVKYGPGKLKDAELLAILLGTGTKGVNVVELSQKIIRRFDEGKLANASVQELREVSGLGTAKAAEIVSCFELGRRFLHEKRSALILSPRDVWEELKDIRSGKKEHFIILFLDTRNQEIRRETISVGSLNASLVHPREVFEPAIQHLAAHIIVAHNHPSGNTEPSDEDVAITRRLAEAGALLGIELLDHVIVASSGFTSLKERGLI